MSTKGKRNDVIPFNKPYLTNNELKYIAEAHSLGQLSGDGQFTKKCSSWLEEMTKSQKVLLTHSCTAALEMAAILADIQPGDEIILPSYTFVSTANAFVLRGGVPVFIDIRSDSLNIDETKIEKAINSRTRAIVPVHYGGVPCEMDEIMRLAREYGLIVIEDAAQAMMADYKGQTLGGIGDFGCFSFHETKNVLCGEGGALAVNNSSYSQRAEIIREKGTNRTAFNRKEVGKYSWVDIGSSYLPGELTAAFLWAQLQEARSITDRRMRAWSRYHRGFEELSELGLVNRPRYPGNAHLYYLILKSQESREKFIELMALSGINCVFHYIPLHNSPYGKKHGKMFEALSITEGYSSRLVRLPLWLGVEEHQDFIIEKASSIIRSL